MGASTAYHAAGAIFLEQTPEADKVLEDTDTSECGRDNRKDGVGAQVGQVMKAEVECYRHADRIDEDEGPEPNE